MLEEHCIDNFTFDKTSSTGIWIIFWEDIFKINFYAPYRFM